MSKNRVSEMAMPQSSLQQFSSQLAASGEQSMKAVNDTVQEYPIMATCGALALGLVAGCAIGAMLTSGSRPTTPVSNYWPANFSGWPAEVLANLKQQLPGCH